MRKLRWLLISGLLLVALSIPGGVFAFTLGVDYDETIQDNGLGAAEAELAVSKFLRTLMAKGLIVMKIPKDSVTKGRS